MNSIYRLCKKKSSNVVWTVVAVSDRMIPVTCSWNLQCNLCCCKPFKCYLQKLDEVITHLKPMSVYMSYSKLSDGLNLILLIADRRT